MIKRKYSDCEPTVVMHLIFRQANDDETPPYALAILSLTADELIRGAIVLNKSTPIDIVKKVSEDQNEYI